MAAAHPFEIPIIPQTAPPKPREVWYGVKYRRVGELPCSSDTIDAMAYAAIVAYVGQHEVAKSAPDDSCLQRSPFAVQRLMSGSTQLTRYDIFEAGMAFRTTYVATIVIRARYEFEIGGADETIHADALLYSKYEQGEEPEFPPLPRYKRKRTD